ncbi:unnamed protein product [Prunus armeniaca]|uniref:Uncharacterized protein n=1 Tax=Prunus armeniaca TaxID=36596 RepID=A0A6J5UB11_PRUAR|nr:unnamed protein product [Prunus armeniaca]
MLRHNKVKRFIHRPSCTAKASPRSSVRILFCLDRLDCDSLRLFGEMLRVACGSLAERRAFFGEILWWRVEANSQKGSPHAPRTLVGVFWRLRGQIC